MKHAVLFAMITFFVLLTVFSYGNSETPSVSNAEGKITGRVISENDNNELSYVAVAVNTSVGTSTNQQGEFVFNNLEYGIYQLALSFIGYEKVVIENVVVSENNKSVDVGTIKLKEKATRIPEVTITAIATNYNGKYKSSNTVISKDELSQSRPIGTEEALKTVAGVNVSGDMGISNRLNIGIRGSYPRRSGKILLLEDGSPIAPAPYLAPEAYYNPPSDRLDGIEIIKGADVLTYGSNTMYGVVNYITKKPPLKPTLQADISGGENKYMSQYVTYGGTWNNVGAELQVLNKSFGGFQDNTQSAIFNTTAKVFADLGSRSSVYMKLNYHQENSKATYSGLTSATYRLNPRKNPFDADDLLTKRYAADLIYNLKISNRITASTKVYASQFARDWWRQNTALIAAKTVKGYLGETLYNQKYSYLGGVNFTDEDFVRVGKISNGRESTVARNRLFRVSGISETLRLTLGNGDVRNNIEVSAKVHGEQFYNQELLNDSSRFARSGKLVKDEKFMLSSLSGHVKNEFIYKKLSIVPALRYEVIEMYRFDMLKLSADPNNDGTARYGSVKNIFGQLIPGVSTNFKLIDTVSSSLEVYGSVYRGYTPPTSDFGFLAVYEGGVVNTKPAVTDINIKPEISTNYEGGIRGYVLNNFINGQATVFNNFINNYYSPGRNEAFQTLGSITIRGTELATSLDFGNLMKEKTSSIKLGVSYTLLMSEVIAGRLGDSDLLNAKHTAATKDEVVSKINSNRGGGYNVYFANDSLITRELAAGDFSKIKKIEMLFGGGQLSGYRVPYVPEGILNLFFRYDFKGFSAGANFNMVGAQYTDYMNLENETADGAIGKLPAYKTIDVNASYKFSSEKIKILNGLSLFLSAKNITDQVYIASRLHRVASGIMPYGFRQVNVGVKITF